MDEWTDNIRHNEWYLTNLILSSHIIFYGTRFHWTREWSRYFYDHFPFFWIQQFSTEIQDGGNKVGNRTQWRNHERLEKNWRKPRLQKKGLNRKMNEKQENILKIGSNDSWGVKCHQRLTKQTKNNGIVNKNKSLNNKTGMKETRLLKDTLNNHQFLYFLKTQWFVLRALV